MTTAMDPSSLWIGESKDGFFVLLKSSQIVASFLP